MERPRGGDRARSSRVQGRDLPFEEVSKVVTADLAYLVQIERFSAKVGGRDEPSSGSLRVAMIFRRESDGWRIAHRHADTITTPRPAESVIHGR